MKKFFLFAGLFISLAVIFTACNGNEPQPQSAQAQLTPEGGVFPLNNGVQLVVPAGAVSENVQVKVEYLEDLEASMAALPQDIQGLVKFSPEGLTFDRPIEVTMPLNQPVADATTDIVYWSKEESKWYLTDIGTVKDGKVTFFVEHFSSYGSVGGDWSKVFAQMDKAVGSLTDEDAISGAIKGVLSSVWDDVDGSRIATRVSTGATCAKICGLFGFWLGEKDGATRQGGGTYKNKSKQNIIITMGLSDHAATSHLKEALEIGGSQENVSRTLELYFDPCETELVGKAKSSSIEIGKTTEVTIQASCGGSPLADQLLQFSCTSELSINVRSQKTDANGEVTITVKGEQDGKGSVHVTAASAADLDLVSEIDVPVKVGAAEWEVTFRIPVTKTAKLISVDSADEGMGESKEEWDDALHIKAYSYNGDTKSVSYTIAGRARFKQAGAQHIAEINMDVPCLSGTSSIWIEEGSVSYNYPTWTSTWEYWDDEHNRIDERIDERKIEYETHYIIHHLPEYTFTTMFYNNRAHIEFYNSADDLNHSLLTDSTLYTLSQESTSYWYDDHGIQHERHNSEASGDWIRVVTDATQMILPVGLYCSLDEEGTFQIIHSSNTSPEHKYSDPYYLSCADMDFHDVFYDETYWPYRGCIPKIEDTVDAIGEITIRLVTEEEGE